MASALFRMLEVKVIKADGSAGEPAAPATAGQLQPIVDAFVQQVEKAMRSRIGFAQLKIGDDQDTLELFAGADATAEKTASLEWKALSSPASTSLRQRLALQFAGTPEGTVVSTVQTTEIVHSIVALMLPTGFSATFGPR